MHTDVLQHTIISYRSSKIEIRRAHVQLFGGEWPPTYTSRIRLHHANRLPNQFRRDTEAGAHATYRSGRRGDEGVGTEVDVEHEGVGAFDEDLFAGGDGFVDECDAVDDVGLEALCESLCTDEMSVKI